MINLYVAVEDLKPNPKEDLEWGKFAFGQNMLFGEMVNAGRKNFTGYLLRGVVK